MPVRFLSDAELARLSGWPDAIADDDLITFFALTADDRGWLGSNVRVENRLGAAVQLCALPWLGWIPDDLAACPVAAVDRLADQLGLASGEVPGLLAAYGGWEGRTRRDHRALVLDRLGWRLFGGGRPQTARRLPPGPGTRARRARGVASGPGSGRTAI